MFESNGSMSHDPAPTQDAPAPTQDSRSGPSDREIVQQVEAELSGRRANPSAGVFVAFAFSCAACLGVFGMVVGPCPSARPNCPHSTFSGAVGGSTTHVCAGVCLDFWLRGRPESRPHKRQKDVGRFHCRLVFLVPLDGRQCLHAARSAGPGAGCRDGQSQLRRAARPGAALQHPRAPLICVDDPRRRRNSAERRFFARTPIRRTDERQRVNANG